MQALKMFLLCILISNSLSHIQTAASSTHAHLQEGFDNLQSLLSGDIAATSTKNVLAASTGVKQEICTFFGLIFFDLMFQDPRSQAGFIGPGNKSFQLSANENQIKHSRLRNPRGSNETSRLQNPRRKLRNPHGSPSSRKVRSSCDTFWKALNLFFLTNQKLLSNSSV